MTTRDQIHSFIAGLNDEYARLHTDKEELFWTTKMGITKEYDEFNKAEGKLQAFRQDVSNLNKCREMLEAAGDDAKLGETLRGWIKFYEANVIEKEEAQKLSEKINEMESELARARAAMNLGYIDARTGEKVPASSVELSLKLQSSDDEALRKACFEGLESIEHEMIEKGFLDIVRERNNLARSLGYEDYYDYKVSTTEGFSKKKLFELMDDLEKRTRDAGSSYVESMKKEHGDDAAKPWNFRYTTQGGATKDLDPYMQFDDALLRWGQGFTALGIKFDQAQLQLDLVVRKGKYENGFCHAPIVPYQWGDTRARSKVNFTSNSVPGQVGSGKRAAETLFHEGGHAAHFSNMLMGAPCFSQEFAPTSAAFAETQSMFCDSLLDDADWMAKYAKNADGQTVPWDVVEKFTRMNQPGRALFIRNLLIVCYAEKMLYELEDADLNEQKVIDEFKKIEKRLCFKDRCPRPTLAVPHLLSGEASCIYHGYVLALAGVSQTRHYFLEKYGYLTDNPEIGPELRDVYWRPGNSITFMEFLEKMTKEPFSMDALVEDVSQSADDAVADQKKKYETALKQPAFTGKVDLDCSIRMVHGSDIIASNEDQSFEEMANRYKVWLTQL